MGLASGLAAVYLSWAVWIYACLNLFKKLGFTGLLELITSPVNLWHYIYYLNGVGSWNIWGYKPTGFVLWILWSLEAVLIIGLSSLFPLFMVAGEFCEACGTWCKQQPGATLRYCDPAELKQHLRAKDLSYLATLGAPRLGANQWLSLTLSRCGKCGTTNTLEARLITVTSDGNGQSTTTVVRPVSRLLLTSTECTVIQKIGQEAVDSAKRS
ncbi:MAG TPA: hypothetical protein VLX28_20940 [Thermoanaerobaculia bacterium]|nr:hypothetical protein [Thermoanaerobaculia bacterium]